MPAENQSVEIDARLIRELTQQWLQLWSPGDEAFGAERFEHYRSLFAQGDNALQVFDDFGGTVTTISGFDQYILTWVPVMARFSTARIALLGEPRVVLSGGMALSTFKFKLDARTRDGVTLANFTYATQVWQRDNGAWRIIHEHLTGSES